MPCANCRENIYKVFPVEFTENPWQVYGESPTSLQGIPAKFTVRHSVQYVYMKPMYKLQGKPVKAIPCRIHRLFLLNLQDIPVDFKNWRPTQMIKLFLSCYSTNANNNYLHWWDKINAGIEIIIFCIGDMKIMKQHE